MLNIDLTMGNNTIIKFGGYDESQISGDISVIEADINTYTLNSRVIYWENMPLNLLN